MSKLKLSEVVAAVEAAFKNTPTPAVQVAPHQIGDNATLRTDVYTGPKGSGFVVTATLDLGWRKLVIARQSGPEAQREKIAPALEALVAECQRERARRYEAQASVYELADAETKLASTDPDEQAGGAAQKAAVLAKRLQIKTAVPKPE